MHVCLGVGGGGGGAVCLAQAGNFERDYLLMMDTFDHFIVHHHSKNKMCNNV